MIKKSSAHYQREYRRRLREQGLVKKEVWIRPENARQLAFIEKQLRDFPMNDPGSHRIEATHEGVGNWTAPSLLSALQSIKPFSNGRARAELIDGIEPSIHIVMHEYGDLPVFLTVSGDQIVVESVLWSADEVKDIHQFNETVLRTHKYYPLSTISLGKMPSGNDYYHMFGSLSSASILSNVVFEIEMLAINVIQATEAYSEYLSIPVGA